MRRLAIAAVVVSVVSTLVSIGLALLNLGTPPPSGIGDPLRSFGLPIGGLAVAGIGGLIASRSPRHPVAWCFLAMGLANVTSVLANYGIYGTLSVPGRPGAGTAMWIAGWTWPFPVAMLLLAVLLFPTGKPPSPRWRLVAAAIIAAPILQGAVEALRMPFVHPDWPIDDPIGTPISPESVSRLAALATLTFFSAIVGAGASLVVRFRRARGAERQQLKWFAYAATVAVALITAGLTSLVTGLFWGPVIFAIAAILPVVLIVLAAAVAILRYHLYDIDLLISRTLVYGLTSAALAAVFYGGLVALQPLLRPLTSGSEVDVAASTLISFGLFQPIRRRVQDAVDRRFARARYDAARTIEAFADRVRDEVDLDALCSELIDAVRQTMGPRETSLWLREHAR